jgi:RIO1 family
MSHSAQTPKILSMEISSKDESEYRLLIDGHVRYLSIAAHSLDIDTLRFLPSLLDALPPLESPSNWTIAYISRQFNRGDLTAVFSERKLAGVQGTWHPKTIDCLRLTRVNQITAPVFEAFLTEPDPALPSIFIAKIARFEWEIPRLERETQAYSLVEGTGLAPRFLGHVAEHGRIIGLLLEKVEGREAGIGDLEVCEAAVRRFHSFGLTHGDLNRFNFLIGKNGVKMIDFENSNAQTDKQEMQREYEGLADQLMEETGRGGGFGR